MTLRQQLADVSTAKSTTKSKRTARFKRIPRKKTSKLITIPLGVCCEEDDCRDNPQDGCAACSSCYPASRRTQRNRVRAKLKSMGYIWVRWKMAPVDEPENHAAIVYKKGD